MKQWCWVWVCYSTAHRNVSFPQFKSELKEKTEPTLKWKIKKDCNPWILTWYRQRLQPLGWLWLVHWSVLQWGHPYSAHRWLNSSPEGQNWRSVMSTQVTLLKFGGRKKRNQKSRHYVHIKSDPTARSHPGGVWGFSLNTKTLHTQTRGWIWAWCGHNSSAHTRPHVLLPCITHSTSARWLRLFHVVSTADENVCFFVSSKSSSNLSHVREKWRERGRACVWPKQLPTLCVKNTPPPFQTLTGHQWGHVFSNMTADSCIQIIFALLYLFHSATHAAVKLSVCCFHTCTNHRPNIWFDVAARLLGTKRKRSTTQLPDKVFAVVTLLPPCHMYSRQTATPTHLPHQLIFDRAIGKGVTCAHKRSTTRLSNLDTWLNVSSAEPQVPLLVFQQ